MKKSRLSKVQILFSCGLALCCLIAGFFLANLQITKSLFRPAASAGTVYFWESERTEPALFLLFPWTRSDAPVGQFPVQLIDRSGAVVQQWLLDRWPLHGFLRENGNLISLLTAPEEKNISKIRGEANTILEVDWQGREVWRLDMPGLHHDFHQFADDKLALLLFEPMRKDLQERYFPQVSGTAFSDRIVILQKSTKEIIWQVALQDYWSELADRVENYDHYDLTHANSIQYLNKQPFSEEPALLVSIRELSTVILIGVDSRRILWKSPRSLVRVQHDAQMLADGSILIFNNGITSTAINSHVLIVDPRNNQIVWKWDNRDIHWSVPYMGGVQRMANGNFLLNNSAMGQLVEIDPTGNIVWNFVGAMGVTAARGPRTLWPGKSFFKARAYPKDFVKLR